MEIGALAAAAVQVLAPALPWLLDKAKDGAEVVINEIGVGVWEATKRLWARIKGGSDEETPVTAAAADVVSAPEDTRTHGALELQLEKAFKADPGLESDVRTLLAEVAKLQPKATYTATLIGDGAIAQGKGAKAVGKGGVIIEGGVHGDVNLHSAGGRHRKEP